jgi:hypothetical protein
VLPGEAHAVDEASEVRRTDDGGQLTAADEVLVDGHEIGDNAGRVDSHGRREDPAVALVREVGRAEAGGSERGVVDEDGAEEQCARPRGPGAGLSRSCPGRSSVDDPCCLPPGDDAVNGCLDGGRLLEPINEGLDALRGFLFVVRWRFSRMSVSASVPAGRDTVSGCFGAQESGR